MAEKFYVTTPIYYVNARPHIGHAYTTIVADVLARRRRLLGEDVWFLTGTDEHGQKIERSAAAAGIAPQQFADEVSASFERLWRRMGITNDQYIRTTDPAHKLGVQKLFADLYAKNQIYLSTYTGQYSIGEEMFVEGPPGTLGPDGRPTETVTEENFFFRLGDYQLRLLNLIESNELAITPESRRNEVLSFLRGNPEDAAGNTGRTAPSPSFPEGRDYVPGALKDLSVSRSSFTWGIPVPQSVQREAGAKEAHVIYVWLDALANYITALGYGSKDESRLREFWPADLHLVGKEIIRFHCVYWPAFLMAAGLPLPRAVTAHGWLLFDDAKMSKSRGNVVRTETILEGFGTLCPATAEPDLFASDVLRYFLLREIPFGQDGSFSFDAMITRYNADLANGYGNLVSRTLNLILQNFEGFVPAIFEPQNEEPTPIRRSATELAIQLAEAAERVAEQFNRLDFREALFSVSAMVARADAFLAETKPWLLARDASRQHDLAIVLYHTAEAVRVITALLYPVIPTAAAAVWQQLGLESMEEAAAAGDLRHPEWGGLPAGTQLGTLGPIFPRADKGLAKIMSDHEAANVKPAAPDATPAYPATTLASEVVPSPRESFPPTDPAAGPRTASLPTPGAAEPGSLVAGSAALTTGPAETPGHAQAPASGIFGAAATQPAQPTDALPQITIDDFAKVELRVAKVLVCERIPKADKLLRLEVDLGHEQRQILSGIAEWYTPEDLIGRRIVVITNLAPRKMRGLESHGMLLAGSAEGGKPALATFADADELPLGARLK